MVVSLSIKRVFYISLTIIVHKSFFPKIFSTSCIILSMPPRSALIMSGTTMILYRLFFPEVRLLAVCILFISRSSSLQCYLLVGTSYRTSIWFFLLVFSTLLSFVDKKNQFCLCIFKNASLSTKLYSVAQTIARIISALLCLARYLLFANILHPAKGGSIVLFVQHTTCIYCTHLVPFTFYGFVSTICSSIDITAAVFLGVSFCLVLFSVDFALHFFLSVNIYPSSFDPFLKASFTLFHVCFQSMFSVSPSCLMVSLSNSICFPIDCMVIIALFMTELFSFNVSSL